MALFSFSPRVDASFGVKVAVADSVVSRILASKKSWNVEIVNAATFDALLSDVQKTTKRQYGEKAARKGKGVAHSWSVSVLVKPSHNFAGQLLHKPHIVILDSLADYTGRADDAGCASGEVRGGKLYLFSDVIAGGYEAA